MYLRDELQRKFYREIPMRITEHKCLTMSVSALTIITKEYDL
ncbi:hypothetical protein SAMN05518672_104472 [Chitinophaga sp. CF118]|nr:hypothetical protein SAMN05518672_104472 [Chitinophaga sp. CF118]